MNINTLSTTARRLNTFFKVLQKIILVCIIVVVAVLLVLTIANAVNPDAVIGTELNSVDIGNISLVLEEELTPDNDSILAYVWVYTFLGIVCAAVVWIALGYIRKILYPMGEGQPFHPDTSRYIKKLAILSLVLGVAQNIGSVVTTLAALRSFGLDKLVANGVIRSVSANFTLDLGFIVIFFVLLLTSYIFSYGAELQKLSDETL